MVSRCSRLVLVALTLIALPMRAEAQFDESFPYSEPDPFVVTIDAPGNDLSNSAPVGACGIVAPSWPDDLLVDCQLNGTPAALQVWKGQPVAGGVPAATLAYAGGAISIPNPTANLLHLMAENMLFLEVLDGTGSTLGSGPIVRPQQQSFTRVTMNGAGHQPPNQTTATGSCDVLLIQRALDGVADDTVGFFDCVHNVPNAQFGQIRRDSPNGPILLDFSDQLQNPMQRGLFPVPGGTDAFFLDDNLNVVIDESLSGARIAGQADCWNGRQANGDQALCQNGGRFRVDIDWTDATGQVGSGIGNLVGPSDDTGLFYFVDPDNWELLVKVIDGCNIEGFNSFWVFAAGLTDVEVTMTVTDTQTNAVKSYTNPLGTPFQPIQDTQAFATCP